MKMKGMKLTVLLNAETKRKLWDLRDALKKTERRLRHAR